MISVGTFEAKTNLAKLLKKVKKGETVLITNRGEPVAKLVPPNVRASDVANVVAEMLERRNVSGPSLGSDMSIKDLMVEGRRR